MSGGTFSVNATPQQLYPGWQRDVTLLNLGPESVWVSSDPSVNPTTSYRLRPNATMKWETDTPLWAVTDNDFSALASMNFTGREHPKGSRITAMESVATSIDNYPSARQITNEQGDMSFPSNVGIGYFRRFIETSSYRALRIDITPYFDGKVNNLPFRLVVNYWNDDKIAMGADEYTFTYSTYVEVPGVSAKPSLSLQVPVYGAYATLSLIPLSASSFELESARIAGLTDGAPITLQTRTNTADGIARGWAPYPKRYDVLGHTSVRHTSFTGWTGALLYLPSAGERLTINVVFDTPVSSAVEFYLQDATGSILHVQRFPGGSATVVPYTVDVPTSSTLIFAAGSGTTFNARVSLTWTQPSLY